MLSSRFICRPTYGCSTVLLVEDPIACIVTSTCDVVVQPTVYALCSMAIMPCTPSVPELTFERMHSDLARGSTYWHAAVECAGARAGCYSPPAHACNQYSVIADGVLAADD
jgi:hypothetical protein